MFRKLSILTLIATLALSCTKEQQPYFGFEKGSVEIVKGSSSKLAVVSSGMEETTIEWSSSDPETVAVDAEGLATAIEYGEAVITAVCGEYQAMCRVNVVTPDVISVHLDKEELEMNIGGEYRLSYSLFPEEADADSVEWSSSDSKVVTVDNTGKLLAIAEGEAVVTIVVDGVEATCKVNVLNKARIGYFYYSDGTFSAELDKSKDVIGVVFWTGNPATVDETLAKDHPDCVNGLVVALNDVEGYFSWQDSVSEYANTVTDWVMANTDYLGLIAGSFMGDYLNEIVGYNNTKAIKAFNDAAENSSWKVPAVEALKEFESSNAAPDGTSGWYMPSAKELSLLCTGTFNSSILEINTVMVENRDLVNESLSQIEGAGRLLSTAYWSSSESDAYAAVTVFFGSGVVVNGQKQNQAQLRYVLAF